MAELIHDDWEQVMTEVDGQPASMVVNLNAATVERMLARQQLFYLTIPLLSPTDNGLPTVEENEDLHAVLLALVNPLAREHNAQLTGHATTDGARTFYFYLSKPDGLNDSLERLLADFGQYTWKFQIEEEPTWETYFDFLRPTPEELQIIYNNRILHGMQEHGDQLTAPRRVDHWAYLPDEEKLAQFKADELLSHFEFEGEEETDAGWRVQFFRRESVQPNDIHRSTIELLRVAQGYGGHYDGWEAEGV
ncbi:MAG: DUF695 domain-containing protein [Acidobacteria bacterium]|nr:DUF695 domain-containing protein [Acidobacteriota bacterium]